MKKQGKTLSEWLTTRFVLVVRDEETFAERAAYRLSYVKILLLFGIVFTVLGGLSFILATTVLAKVYDPRVAYREADRRLIEMEKTVDSLQVASDEKDVYMASIKAIIDGEVEDAEDIKANIVKQGEVENIEVDLKKIDPVDSLFRSEFEDLELKSAPSQLTTASYDDVFFFPPVSNGVLSKKFDIRKGHYGVDVLAKRNEGITAISEGTVILASWTQDSGYVIGIQHRGQVISFYKHNSVLLKKVGETVRTGDIIAIIGNSGEMTDGQHLHFELWVNGNPVDPLDFISFE
ncbi:M23 family metallopeptidase [Flammeovirga kamogawensis]|uniref:M23 family metallopeptidase n=1 Tax=Flammeovirga kamogawensis TaxID=373891 RepID=A0ABX8GR32_9BACT|nr:M23 family metallopeptidase [Flammeovirga kamogawensis]MBB6462033.1 murein DD-endopeptidase MepM/ murein hydrolase activator NlpD [Flammeovirga kamogawensis]QWG05768.1 M23 family metallopeptidase [Flammeovirga kamogawensis]TRX67595.1 M23 family metallopeptidase [Flammeovirga kamogawensis]